MCDWQKKGERYRGTLVMMMLLVCTFLVLRWVTRRESHEHMNIFETDIFVF